MIRLQFNVTALLMVLLLPLAIEVRAGSAWERYDISGVLQVNHPRFASPRTIEPKCSGGPVVDATGVRPGNEQFAFFISPGKANRLLIFFDGGGACWEDNTCLLSPFFPLRQPPGRATYNQEIPANFEPFPGGILDLRNRANPFYDWTVVFIPYCTGDVHWGSKDVVYTFPAGTPLAGTAWPMHHRGFDNFLAVLDFLKDDLAGMKQVAVAGSSAGAYGAVATFPFIQEMLPEKARTYLLADAGNGVVNQAFVMDALKEQWDVAPNMATWLPGISAALLDRPDAANILEVALVSGIARAYPHTRLAQYTTAWDAVQTQFLNIMEEIENPLVWSDPDVLLPRFCEWSARAHAQAYASALASNYRFYIGAGTSHTVLPGLPIAGFGNIYAEDSARGVPMVDWVTAMLRKNGKSPSGVKWKNVQCATGQCEPPFPPTLCQE